MSEAEDQIEDINVSSDISSKSQDIGTWGKKLCGLNWRIDVPVPANEGEENSEPPQPFAVVEAIFSSKNELGKDVCYLSNIFIMFSCLT